MFDVARSIIIKGMERGLDGVEVFLVRSRVRHFAISKERIYEAVDWEEVNIGIRGSIGKRVGAIRTNSTAVGEDVLDKLISITRAAPEDPHWPGFPPKLNKRAPALCYDKKIADLDEEGYVKLIDDVMSAFKDAALSKGAEEAVVVEGALGARVDEFLIANSNNVEERAVCTSLLAWMTLSVAKGGYSSDKSLVYAKRKLDEGELLDTARGEGSKALDFIGAAPIESGKYDIILAPEAAGAVMRYALAPAFSGLNILEGRSPLKGKEGQEVFDKSVTILDDPTLEYGYGSRAFDDEGIGTSYKEVVSSGVFKRVLHSYYTARRAGSEPTGNGFRSSPSSPPMPSFTNFVVKPVKGSLEEFKAESRNAIIVDEIIGYWMSNPFTGNAKATVTHGLLVKDGEIVKPVKGVVIGGNIYKWLREQLGGIGTDLKLVEFVAAPSILIRDVNVAGK